MRDAKKGAFYVQEPQRTLANNSAVYNEKPTATQFMEEWLALAKSGSGERGIFNRGGLKSQLPERRWKIFEEDAATSGTNPCGEIVLKSKQFCNLSEVVCRAEDTEETLLKKMKIATIIGTYQSTLTDYPYLSKEWKKNCEEERLLGVSLTGQWDCPAIRNPETLRKMKELAVEVNKEYAKKFGINQSSCITCVKPSGTVSQLVDAASGGHARHSQYYIRRVRIAATDSLFQMMKDQKVPYYPEVGQSTGSASTYVLEFPVKAPDNAIFKNDLSASKQLEHWKMVKENYTEHNPSVTISVGEEEWVGVSNWLYENWNILGGLSFLPRDNHVYMLAPYEEITKERYEEMMEKFPKIDFSQIIIYEKEDQTQGAKELACVSGVCEIDAPVTEKITATASS
jgi:ribonucleoside-diphosphate reductase alpha chain